MSILSGIGQIPSVFSGGVDTTPIVWNIPLQTINYNPGDSSVTFDYLIGNPFTLTPGMAYFFTIYIVFNGANTFITENEFAFQFTPGGQPQPPTQLFYFPIPELYVESSGTEGEGGIRYSYSGIIQMDTSNANGLDFLQFSYPIQLNGVSQETYVSVEGKVLLFPTNLQF